MGEGPTKMGLVLLSCSSLICKVQKSLTINIVLMVYNTLGNRCYILRSFNCRLEFKIDRLIALAFWHRSAQYKLMLATPRHFSFLLCHHFFLDDANHRLNERYIARKESK